MSKQHWGQAHAAFCHPKHQLQGELDLSRRIGGADRAERRTGRLRVRYSEIRVFRTLKNSARNCSRTFSRIRKFLSTEKSH
jgi:hypothetical protein